MLQSQAEAMQEKGRGDLQQHPGGAPLRKVYGNMRVGVATYSNTKSNYGQMLQLWAMQKHLQSMGNDPFLIRYVPNDMSPLLERIRENLSLKSVMYVLSGERRKDAALASRAEILDTHRRFDAFLDNEVALSDRAYDSYAALAADPPEADAYVCGSDQIWGGSLFSDGTRGFLGIAYVLFVTKGKPPFGRV